MVQGLGLVGDCPTNCGQHTRSCLIHQAQYTSFANGLTISWDAKAKAYKMQLHGASATAAFSMPQQALANNSKIHPG